MTTCMGKSCSFGLPRVPFVNCCQFMYLVIFLLDHLVWGRSSWSLCLLWIYLLAMHTFICVSFSLPPGVRDWLRLVLGALPWLFCLPFWGQNMGSDCIISWSLIIFLLNNAFNGNSIRNCLPFFFCNHWIFIRFACHALSVEVQTNHWYHF